MSNSLNPVFGDWYVGKQLGNGTDGKVFSIYRKKYDGTRETAVMKMLRLGENRNERKTFNINNYEEASQQGYEKIIKTVRNSIETVKKADNGKFFIRYEDIELRNASDGKGKLILIKLEEGKSLAQVLKGFSFTLEETYRLGINICQALNKCRSFDYVYPNLKPENIIFDKEGRCKIGDFGSFSCLEPAKTSISYKRTQYYMAPEFIKTGNINCTCDTYSLGLILYMLTNRGRLPFTEPYPNDVTVNSLNESTERRMRGEELPKPALASDQMWKIIKKACAFKVNERYFTPEQMLSDLRNALNNQPFDDSKFDDVYSESKVDDENDASVLIPNIEKTNVNKESKTKVVSIKEEIQIPYVAGTPEYKPSDNPANKRAFAERKIEKIVDTKPVTKFDFYSLGKLILSALTAIIFVLIFLGSVLLNVNAVNDNSGIYTTNPYENLLFCQGVMLYGS